MALGRVLALLQARLRAESARGAPIAPLLTHALLSAFLCGLARGELETWAYALCAFTWSAALVALPLLGDFGAILRADPAAEWIEAQPVSPFELRVARTLHVLIALTLLALASLLPAAALAPAPTSLLARAAFVLAGLGLVYVFAAALLLVQGALGGRAEALLVLCQTFVMVAAVLGLVLGLRQLPALRALERSAAPFGGLLVLYPPAWFASPFLAASGFRETLPALAAGLCALGALVLAPSPRAPAARARTGALERLLAPARALASRTWVRTRERGAFDLVYDALPREREFVLRTYPMLGLPLAFLWLGARNAGQAEREGLLALLLFSTGVYLPILLTQVPCSTSHAARWLLDSAPLARRDMDEGAIKAIAVRFLLPLHAVLSLLAWQQVGLSFALRIAPLGALASLLVLRRLYRVCVADAPLSVAPDELRAEFDWFGTLGALALLLALSAVLAWKYATTPLLGLALCALLLAWELRRSRRDA